VLHRMLRVTVGASLVAATVLFAAPPAPSRAAITPTHYRPSHLIHFDAGSYTGYRFSSTGTVIGRKSATLARSSTASTSLRTAIAGQSGAWLYIVNGIWAGYYVRESHRTYPPFTRFRLVSFSSGSHTGYRFDAAGRVISRKTSALSRSSSASASAQALIGTTSYLLIANGIWAGYWVPASSTVFLRYPPLGPNRLRVSLLSAGLSQPLFVTNAHDGSRRVFVVERSGRIRIITGTTLQPTAFLDITSKVGCCEGERGLLGLAFDPAFGSNRRLYVYYTNLSGNIVISRYTANSIGTSVSPTTESILLTIPHPTYANHDGGWMGFGKDGNLYIATGDGGGAGDPFGNAQNTNSRLGKMLRINVSGSSGYTIPPTNPFATSGGAKEVWAWGLRNPWRDSFDRLTGDLYIGDVGQGSYEEIDRAASGMGRQNYGWDVMEGFACYNATSCATAGKTLPIAAYAHGTNESIGCSVTGGYIYRGSLQPQLQGHYLLADFCSGRIWSLYQDENVADLVQQAQAGLSISSFGEAEDGEIYVTDLSGGGVYRIVLN
jgi:glucose/arabinose dehydrogenase